MKVLELINQRRSVRTFDGVALKEDDAKKDSRLCRKSEESVSNPRHMEDA